MPCGHAVPEQRDGVTELERRQRQGRGAPVALGAGDDDRQALGRLAVPERQRQQHRCSGRTAQQRADDVDGGRVGPVQVVEDHHQRLVGGEARQQGAHGRVEAVALRGAAQLAERLVEVGLERVGPGGQREVRLVLGGASGQDARLAFSGPRRDLFEDARLADARLTRDHQRRGRTRHEAVEHLVEHAQLGVATDQRRLRRHGHGATLWRRSPRFQWAPDPVRGAVEWSRREVSRRPDLVSTVPLAPGTGGPSGGETFERIVRPWRFFRA